MSERFNWEKSEEEKELKREEEEVALLNFVDFALLPEDNQLDVANVAVSQQEEASQSEVNRASAQPKVDDENVFDFDEDQETHARELHPPPQAPSNVLDAEDRTIAQP